MQTIVVTGSSDANAYTARRAVRPTEFDLSLRDTRNRLRGHARADGRFQAR
jgi:hypothetical protein